MTCTTHHHACQCREDKAKHALDMAFAIIEHNIPHKPIIYKALVKHYRDLYGHDPATHPCEKVETGLMESVK
jgi:hypothetical protein